MQIKSIYTSYRIPVFPGIRYQTFKIGRKST
jgi:hypothetical protein